MDFGEILKNLDNHDIKQMLVDMSKIHMYTKHYLLVAEELSSEGVVFLQPLKEHRDAYDHLCRIFFLDSTSNIKDEKAYIQDNVKKALGHEYRAFFDTVDWLTFICRKYIREQLSYRGIRKEYQGEYDYSATRKFVNDLPFEIAKYREQKDISNKNSLLKDVDAYREIVERLLDIYKEIQQIQGF